jgi:hypothetical protein
MEINVIGTEADVCADISRRQQMGIKKYNSTVRDNDLSLKQWLQHAYEETLDKAIYLKRAIEQIDKDNGSALVTDQVVDIPKEWYDLINEKDAIAE